MSNRIKAEVLSIGTELLLGEITDTNAAFLASQLPLFGAELRRVTQVGDNRKDLCQALRQALRRSDLVITSGGLGPTADDLTRECIAGVMGEELTIDAGLEGWLRGLFARMRREMPQSNINQAMLIPSARPLINENGTAPGWWCEKNGKVIIALPGPPREMKGMWDREAAPRLRARFACPPVLTCIIKTFGLGEAKAGEMAEPFFKPGNPALGIYAKPDGIHLRLIARGDNAEELIRSTRQKLERIFISNIWGKDDDTLPVVVGRMLVEKGLSLALAEDGTRGLLSGLLSGDAQSGKYFSGGLILAGNTPKIAVGIPAELLQEHGAISPGTAQAMAELAREKFSTDIGLSATGIAGIDGPEAEFPATLYIGVADGRGAVSYQQTNIPYREDVRNRAAIAALFRLRQSLLEG